MVIEPEAADKRYLPVTRAPKVSFTRYLIETAPPLTMVRCAEAPAMVSTRPFASIDASTYSTTTAAGAVIPGTTIETVYLVPFLPESDETSNRNLPSAFEVAVKVFFATTPANDAVPAVMVSFASMVSIETVTVATMPAAAT